MTWPRGFNTPFGARCFDGITRPSRSVRTRLNAPFGARWFMTGATATSTTPGFEGLNTPYGARCFMTEHVETTSTPTTSLNAPFGARCFMTKRRPHSRGGACEACLNAPFGARCFMTTAGKKNSCHIMKVLIHRLALGAL